MTTIDRNILKKEDNLIKNNIAYDKRYQYVVLEKKHVDRVVDLFTHSFCDSEPMTRYLNMQYEPYSIFARIVTEKAAKDGFSLVALDGDILVACALSEDLTDPLPMMPEFDPKLVYIFTLLEQMGAAFFSNKKFSKNEIAHLFITAVNENYRSQGVSQQINFRAMNLALQQHFDFMYCEFTNYINEKGTIPHLKNRKRLIGSSMYKKFQLKGEYPFKNLEGGANSYLWEVRDNAPLIYTIDHKQYVEYL